MCNECEILRAKLAQLIGTWRQVADGLGDAGEVFGLRQCADELEAALAASSGTTPRE
jgi:hypothetical protein